MFGLKSKLTTTAVILSLCAVPTGAIAAAPASVPASTARVAATGPSSPWVALGAMSASSSASAAAFAQDDYREGSGFPPVVPLAIILGTLALAIYILVSDDDGDIGISRPVEPPVSPN